MHYVKKNVVKAANRFIPNRFKTVQAQDIGGLLLTQDDAHTIAFATDGCASLRVRCCDVDPQDSDVFIHKNDMLRIGWMDGRDTDTVRITSNYATNNSTGYGSMRISVKKPPVPMRAALKSVVDSKEVTSKICEIDAKSLLKVAQAMVDIGATYVDILTTKDGGQIHFSSSYPNASIDDGDIYGVINTL